MILNIYKEKGWTSFDVVAKLRSLLKTKKIGHAGTLDPLAEGVLIVLTDSDTKRQDEFMHMEKEYEADVVFGATSPTLDLEGPISFSDIEITKYLKSKDLKKILLPILKNYTGEFEQTVPAYSAKKLGGKELYKLARSGKLNVSDLPTKKVHVKSISLVRIFSTTKLNGGLDLPVVTLNIVCNSGFYVRSLADALGKELGLGALTLRILRKRVGDFSVGGSRKIKDLITEATL